MRIKKILLLSPFVICLSLLCVSSCMTFRKSDSKTLAFFEGKVHNPKIGRVNFENSEVRYVETGHEIMKEAVIIFVHGAPGSSQDFLAYLADSVLLKSARLVAVDRLGYGYSDYGNEVTSIAKQARLINFLIDEAKEEIKIVVGHSYGGPIVAKAAANNPNIDAVLMLAPVSDPYNEKIFWIANIGKWKITKWMISKAFQVSASEKFTHADELMLMKDDWKKIRVPIVHIHGYADFIAPISNIEWSNKNIDANYLKMIDREKLNHFIPWENHKLVQEQLMYLLGESRIKKQ